MFDTKPDLCARCGKTIEEFSKSRWCGSTCKSQEWRKDKRIYTQAFLAKPLVHLPVELQPKVPDGDEGVAATLAYLLRIRAPASARGFRVGSVRGKGQDMRWFPSSVNRGLPMFRLEPFEIPAVPFRGRYAVVFTDIGSEPIAEPTFTIEIPFRDRHLRFTDGDTSFWPRLRNQRLVFRPVRVRSEHAEG